MLTSVVLVLRLMWRCMSLVFRRMLLFVVWNVVLLWWLATRACGRCKRLKTATCAQLQCY